jgi:integrase
MKLTNAWLQSARPPEGLSRVEVTDDHCRGLAAVVGRTGVSFICRFMADGKRQRVKLGEFPALSLADARVAAGAMMANVANGKDPQAGALVTVADAFKLYWVKRQTRLTHAEQDRSTWRRLISPVLGDVKLSALSPLHYDKLVLHWEARDMRSGQSSPFRVAHHFQNWLLNRDLIAKPFIPREAKKELPKVEHTTDAPPQSLVQGLWAAAGGWGRPGAVLRLLALTGARRAMIEGLRWEEVVADADGRGLLFGPSRMKGKRAFWIPLSAAAAALIDAQPGPEVTGSAYVFPAGPRARTDAARRGPLNTDLNQLARPVLGAHHVHDLRRAVAVFSTAWGPHLPACLLAHAPAEIVGSPVTALYLGNPLKLYAAERRAVLEAWAGVVTGVSANFADTLPAPVAQPVPMAAE